MFSSFCQTKIATTPFQLKQPPQKKELNNPLQEQQTLRFQGLGISKIIEWLDLDSDQFTPIALHPLEPGKADFKGLQAEANPYEVSFYIMKHPYLKIDPKHLKAFLDRRYTAYDSPDGSSHLKRTNPTINEIIEKNAGGVIDYLFLYYGIDSKQFFGSNPAKLVVEKHLPSIEEKKPLFAGS